MKYATIVADCPWQYRNEGVNGAAEKHYPTMSVEELCWMPIEAIAADDAVMYFWGVWPLLPDALTVIKAWGFTYVTGFPWIKIIGEPVVDLFDDLNIRPTFGTGWWVRGVSEPLLICKRGDARPIPDPFVGLLSNNFQHSRKPANVYQMAERHPGPRLELFARRPRDGWDAFGNQVAGSIALPERGAHVV